MCCPSDCVVSNAEFNKGLSFCRDRSCNVHDKIAVSASYTYYRDQMKHSPVCVVSEAGYPCPRSVFLIPSSPGLSKVIRICLGRARTRLTAVEDPANVSRGPPKSEGASTPSPPADGWRVGEPPSQTLQYLMSRARAEVVLLQVPYLSVVRRYEYLVQASTLLVLPHRFRPIYDGKTSAAARDQDIASAATLPGGDCRCLSADESVRY